MSTAHHRPDRSGRTVRAHRGAGARNPPRLPDRQLHFVCVLKGAFMFLGDLDSRHGRPRHHRLHGAAPATATARRRPAKSGCSRISTRPRRPRRHHRRRHRRYRPDAALPAGDPARPRPAHPAHRVPAEQAVAPQDRRQGRLHRLHDRGPVRRRLRPRLRRAVPQPALHRRAASTWPDAYCTAFRTWSAAAARLAQARAASSSVSTFRSRISTLPFTIVVSTSSPRVA